MSNSARFSAKPFVPFYVGDNQFVLHHHGATERRQLDAGAVQLLNLCQRAETLEDHGAAIEQVSGGMLPVSRLNELVMAGLLVNCATVRGAAPRTAPSKHRISTVAIPTAGRSDLLRRCLQSLVAHCKRHGESPRILVVDGSPDEASRNANRCELASLARQWDGGAVYVGEAEAAFLRDLLHGRGADRQLLEFAFTPGTTGSNRNLILALTRGEQVLMVDDDVVCETWESAGDGRLAVTGHEDPCETRYFRTRAEALSSVTFTEANLMDAHGRLLGRSIAALVPEDAALIEVGTPCASVLHALEGIGAGEVVLTFAGLAGDSGIYCPYRALFSAQGPGHVADLAEAEYQAAFTSRERTRIAPRNTVTHSAQCMAYCMGLTNERMLPPFSPLGRNQDGLFGALLGLCDEDAFYGHLPCGIVHDSLRPSNHDVEMRSAGETRIADVLTTLLSGYRVSRVPSGEMRLAWLGSNLTLLADLPERQFQAEVQQAILEKRSTELTTADRLISIGCGSPRFQHDVDRYRQRFLAEVRQVDFLTPVEFRGGDAVAFQLFVRRFGELMQEWALVLETAGAVNAEFWESLTPAVSTVRG